MKDMIASAGAFTALTLRAWTVFDARDGWHLVGWCPERATYCVSDAVVRFDASKSLATTVDSRAYRLAGPPRVDVKALGAWTRYALEHNAMRGVRDVTHVAWTAIRGATGASWADATVN
jgi:hypothetical protein